MRYLLDANACISYLNDRVPFVAQHLQEHIPSDVPVCSIVRAELYFDDMAASTYAKIRADLTGRGSVIGPNDLLIAAIAVSRHLILVTHNTREFSRVGGLALEDWETG